MADLTPNNREEYWLKGMVDGQTTLEPNKRREYWYKEIVDAIGSGGGGGTGGGVLVVNLDPQTNALDKTWNEINNAAFAIIKYIDPNTEATIYYNIATIVNSNGRYVVGLFEYDGEAQLDKATTDEVAQTKWLYPDEIKELYNQQKFVSTLTYFFDKIA